MSSEVRETWLSLIVLVVPAHQKRTKFVRRATTAELRPARCDIPSQFPAIAHSVSSKSRKAVAPYWAGSNELDEEFVRRSWRKRFVREPMQMIDFFVLLFRIVPVNDKFNRRAGRTNKWGLEEEILVESVSWLFCSELEAPKDDKTGRVESIVADFQLVRTHVSVWKR